MPTVTVPTIAGGGSLPYAWLQPSEGQLDESLGEDTQRAVAKLKVAGDATSRYKAAACFLEYAVRQVTNGIPWVARNPPWMYQAFQPPPGCAIATELGQEQGPLFANRFTGSDGKGPSGQATPANAGSGSPIPVYEYMVYGLECTARPYSIQTDADVAAPGSINAAWTAQGNPTLTQLANPPVGVSANNLLQPNIYEYCVTALPADGETFLIAATTTVVNVIYGVKVQWQALQGALGYKVYVNIPSIPNSIVWVCVPLGAGVNSYTVTGTEPNVPGGPSGVDDTASPLWNGGGGAQLPDEGAALAFADGETGERYVERDDEDFVKGLVVPRGVMTFCDTGFSITEGILREIPFSELEYTWIGCPRDCVPWDAIRNLIGCVAVTTFDGWPPWTLLFKGAKIRRYRNRLGVRAADLRYRFSMQLNRNLLGLSLGHLAALEFTGGKVVPNQNAYRFGLPGQVDWSTTNADRNGHGTFNYPFCQSFAPLFRGR